MLKDFKEKMYHDVVKHSTYKDIPKMGLNMQSVNPRKKAAEIMAQNEASTFTSLCNINLYLFVYLENF